MSTGIVAVTIRSASVVQRNHRSQVKISGKGIGLITKVEIYIITNIADGL